MGMPKEDLALIATEDLLSTLEYPNQCNHTFIGELLLKGNQDK